MYRILFKQHQGCVWQITLETHKLHQHINQFDQDDENFIMIVIFKQKNVLNKEGTLIKRNK